MISFFREKPLRMLWRIEKDAKLSSIVGTAHFFPHSYRKAFTRLMRDASAVLFEGPLDRESMAVVARYGMEGEGAPSVLKALNPEVVKKINRRLSKAVEEPAGPATGLRMIRLSSPRFLDLYADGVRPWMALFATWSAFLRTKGWKNSMDLEAYTIAARLRKNVRFLETIDEQLAALDEIPFDRIAAFLNAFEEWDRYAERHLNLMVDGRYEEMISSTTMFPSRCQSIVDDRDPVLFDRMKQFVDEGRALAFVGTTHVMGITRMFETEGYRVKQETT
jgi:hypothetical protein